MNKIKNMKDKMPDVFYAMKRENQDDDNLQSQNQINNRRTFRKRNNVATEREDYYSTDSTESESCSELKHKSKKSIKPKLSSVPQSQPQLTPRQKFWKRFYSTWTMIFGLTFIVYVGHTALCCLCFIIQALGFREIAVLGSKPRKETQLPGFYLLHWHFFLTSIFFLYGQLLMEHLLIGVFDANNDIMQFVCRHHGFLSFTLFTIGIISFVLSLKKGFYKYQFKQLGWCVAIIIIVVVQSTFVMANIMDGIIWFFVPCAAIVTNDIWAYMCGKAFGKRFISTPLINLSPNKTWEGQIGASFFTILFTYAFATFLIDYEFFVCPKKGFSLEYPTCTPSDIFIAQPMYGFNISSFQIHSIVFALYASLITPFGGFFASGFKRAFKLKDFSQSVGFGHGGVLDRMDCQILMCVFVYAYRQSFVGSKHLMGIHQITQNILQLSKEDQLQLLNNLKNIVAQN